MQFVFFDVEALGPPGAGDLFALGAARFDPTKGQILDRWHRNIRPGTSGNVRATMGTLDWLLGQSSAVLAQLRDQGAKPFAAVYQDFIGWARVASPETLILCADDWSDFAWMEYEAHSAQLGGLRRPNVRMYDTSFLDNLPPARSVAMTRLLTPHVAGDDAEAGALRLMERWAHIGHLIRFD